MSYPLTTRASCVVNRFTSACLTEGDPSVPERPVAVLAMQPWALPGLFPADLLERLREHRWVRQPTAWSQ